MLRARTDEMNAFCSETESGLLGKHVITRLSRFYSFLVAHATNIDDRFTCYIGLCLVQFKLS